MNFIKYSLQYVQKQFKDLRSNLNVSENFVRMEGSTSFLKMGSQVFLILRNYFIDAFGSHLALSVKRNVTH